MTTASTIAAPVEGRSPFAGVDVCQQAGLRLPDGVRRPMFDDDLWDFTDIVGLPVEMPLADRRFDFTPIPDPRWRLVAKELVLALLAPHHPAVAPLPRAYRTPLHLRSCSARREEAARLLAWLTDRGTTSLAELDTHTCEAYLAFRRYLCDDDGAIVGEHGPSVRCSAAQSIVDLVDYRDLFTADRVRADLRPWGGATASAVAEMPSGRAGNKTQPVAGEVLQPMLAAALHLIEVHGERAVELAEQIRDTDRASSLKVLGLRQGSPTAIDDIISVLADYTTTGAAAYARGPRRQPQTGSRLVR